MRCRLRGGAAWVGVWAAIALGSGCERADPQEPGKGGAGGGGAAESGGAAGGGGAGGGDGAAGGGAGGGDGAAGGGAGGGDGAAGGGAGGGDGAAGGGGAGGGGSGEAPSAPRSCTSGDTELRCGPEGRSCCESTLVPGGTFLRSFDGEEFTDDSNPATVSDFLLDTFEITVGRFRAFVDAGQGTQVNPPAMDAGAHPKIPGMGWDTNWLYLLAADTAELKAALHCRPDRSTWTDEVGANESLPLGCITYLEALAFCAWDGGRLPTEAEWNYAAAGGDEQRVYPWGRELGSGDGAGRWGHQNLAGGVSEMVIDYKGDYPNPCIDCAKTVPHPDGWYLSVRGGLYEIDLHVAKRSSYRVPGRLPSMGARCARNAPPAR
ncbi:uncharacterized protein SOCE26_080220 [Sorangium cellulosum]|uniref:Sulfatase-modifying factor enzyme-like domain-containing protein n=1 Tax=Sorangium cellulosum TaxID=56 RepID=A0A2L0F4P9_SORCE|nr:SUMF1/EgtB/PvdO family nonheme iron enzyme [Sorangium cellulosum]AUX46516.1 uncharacterized protein SOCE26_080220 [Sorangium cellulosum]